MFTVTLDQKITSWNATAEKLLGRRQDQVLGKKCYEVMLANGVPGRIKCKRGCAVVTNAVKGRTTRDFDLECMATDGSHTHINMSILLLDQDSGGRRVLHLFRDVTDRRRVERASTDPLYLNSGSRQSGKLAGAGLDVTDPEPLPQDHDLWGLDNVIITSHIAARSQYSLYRRDVNYE